MEVEKKKKMMTEKYQSRFSLHTHRETSEARQIITATFDLLSVLAVILSATRASATACIGKLRTTQQLSLRSLSTPHINTNSAHLARRHYNEILCASTMCSLPLFLSFCLSAVSIDSDTNCKASAVDISRMLCTMCSLLSL